MIRLFNDRLEKSELHYLLTTQDEEVILAAREHVAPMLLRCFYIFCALISVSSIAAIGTFILFNDIVITIGIYLLVLFILSGLITREIIHWHLHIYLITNKKISELRFTPLFSEISNYILLDQLRCTEIDTKRQGLVPELLNMGDVSITFDRPTHQEEFVLKNIRSPRRTAHTLSAKLQKTPSLASKELWMKIPNQTRYTFLQENNEYTLPN